SGRGRALPEGEGNREASFAGILVAVSPAEGEKIAFALEHGSLYLALDGYEASPALTPGAAPQTIFAGPPAAPLPAGVSSSGSAGRN
ncbi:MAG: hypothetical protein M1337_02520, partial [Actinobacteria bacterium]|nr:hypothetical protein [Actinomycetota bacterium]